MADENNTQRSFLRKLLSGSLSFALAMALVPVAALARPQVAEAATAVPEVEVTRVNTGKVVLAKGMNYKLGAVSANGAKLTYKSSKKSVVSVSSKGTIALLKTGKATITVTATLGKKKVTEKISVTSVKPSKYVAVKKATVTLSNPNLRVGESCKAKVTFTPKNASNKNVVFKSSNPDVLVVSAKGVVTAVGEGRATISATSCANKKVKVKSEALAVAPVEDEGEDQPSEPEKPVEPEQPAAPEQPSPGGGNAPSYPSGGGGGSATAPTVVSSESVEIDDEYNSTVTYADDVKVVSGVSYTLTTNSLGVQTITFSKSRSADVSTVKSGDIIVLEPTDTNPGGCVVTVGSVNVESGTITITGTAPDVEDVFKDIDVQGISTQASSFEPAEGVEIVSETLSRMSLRTKKPAGTESIDMGTLTLNIPDVEFGSGAKATVEVKFKAAAEYIVKGLGKDMVAYVGLNQKSSLVGSLETKNYLDKNDRGDIRLGTIKFPTKVPGMFIAVNLFAVLSAKGSVEIAFSSTGDIGWLYKDRKHQMVATLKQGCDGVKVEGKLKAGFDFDLSLDILSKRIIDAAFGLGENLKGSLEVRPTTMICCEAEIGAYGSVSVGKHSALEDFGISYEKEIDLGDFFPSMNVNAHFEIPAGLKGFNKVEKCTWNDASEKPGSGEAGGGSSGGGGGSSGGGGGGSRPDEGNKNESWNDEGYEEYTTIHASGVCGTCVWKVMSNPYVDSGAQFFILEPANGVSGMLDDWVANDPEGDWEHNTPWYSDVSGVTHIQIKPGVKTLTGFGMFSDFQQRVKTIDLSDLDTSSVTDMYGMFANLSLDEGLDLSNFDTSNVTNMSHMFCDFYSPSINLSSFDTTNVTDMYAMFWNTYFEEISLPNFNTAKVENMGGMFSNCRNLKSVDLSNFDLSSVTDMSAMFIRCPELVSVVFPQSNPVMLEDMHLLFAYCPSIQNVDFSPLNLPDEVSSWGMFKDCAGLKTIYVGIGWNDEALVAYDMFEGCTSLVGGNGTAYSNENSNAYYARVDTAETPGYFTLKGVTSV